MSGAYAIDAAYVVLGQNSPDPSEIFTGRKFSPWGLAAPMSGRGLECLDTAASVRGLPRHQGIRAPGISNQAFGNTIVKAVPTIATSQRVERSIGDHTYRRAPVPDLLPYDLWSEIADADLDEVQLRDGIGAPDGNGPVFPLRFLAHGRVAAGKAFREQPGFGFILPGCR